MNSATEKLWFAIKTGALFSVRAWINQGANIHDLNSFGETPLHEAARQGSAEICRVLIRHGAGVNALSFSRYTPLQLAAMKDKAEACALLLQRGANVNWTSEDGLMALHNSAAAGALASCKVLLANGANVNALSPGHNDTPMHFAVSSRMAQSLEVCQLLVEKGADPSMVPEGADSEYLTPFQSAVENGCIDIANFFLDTCAESLDQVSFKGKDLMALAQGEPEVQVMLRSRITEAAISEAMALGEVGFKKTVQEVRSAMNDNAASVSQTTPRACGLSRGPL